MGQPEERRRDRRQDSSPQKCWRSRDQAGMDGALHHDVRGNRTGLADRIGSPVVPDVTWAYDKADRMTSRTADSVTVTYTYDANGNMLTASGPTGTITAAYDRHDRPTSVAPDDGSTTTTISYGLTSGTIVTAAGTFDYGLDRWGRETSMDLPYGGTLTHTWRPDGQLRRTTDPNGNQTDRTYDDAGRLASIITTDTDCTVIGGSVCATATYTRNRAGLVRTESSDIRATGITDPANGTASFAYDALGRLIDYDSPVASTDDRDYAWAKVLDRTGVTSDPSGTPSTVTTTYDAADRPTVDSAGGSYTHDAQGRMTAKPGQKLEWDSLGRLRKVRDAGTNAVLSEYTYDALDRLREVTSSGTTTRFRYVGTGTTVAQTYNVTTSTGIRRYASGWDGELVGDFNSTAGNERTYWRNGHGDITWLAGSTGVPVRTMRYDPFGQVIGTAGSAGPAPVFRFQGSWRDAATDLTWVITRWYAPELGRFISEDSLLGEPDNPDSRHLYAYGVGDPVNRWDPDGRIPILIALFAVAVPVITWAAAVERVPQFTKWMQSFMNQDIRNTEDLLRFLRKTGDSIFGNKEEEAAMRALVVSRIYAWKEAGSRIPKNDTCYSQSSIASYIVRNTKSLANQSYIRKAAIRPDVINVPVLSSVCVRFDFWGGRLTTPRAYDRRLNGRCKWEPSW